jgi:hypothetical protein
MGRLGRVLAIYVGVGVLTAAAIFIYLLFARYFPQSGMVTILIWFLVAQALLWLRWMLRLASWGAVVGYYRSEIRPAEAVAVAS